MDNSIDINAYFNRIGFKNDALPDLDTLRELHILHTLTIPFENLNPLLQIPVLLDIDSIQSKLVDQQRGGYCFEQNLLFQKVLERIGFNVTPLSGRVLLNKHEDTITPKTHQILLVNIQNTKYIVDVGFGGQSPCEPILLETDKIQETSHGNYRVLEREDFYLLQISIRHRWTNLYRFTTRKSYKIDYEVANWYTSTHPDSKFTKKLTVALAGKDCRYVLNDNVFKIYYTNGEIEKQILSNPSEVIEVLEEVFGLDTSLLHGIEKIIEERFFSKSNRTKGLDSDQTS